MMNSVVEEDTSSSNVGNQYWEHTPARILVVDDFAPFREFTSVVLKNHVGFQVVAEAADGREAIQKARESRPNLVVLDMDLPLLCGIEVARQIRLCSPDTAILFLSGNSDPDVVEAALETGALGYVLKLDAVDDLLDAAKVVLSGQRFVSRRLRPRTELC